MWDFFRRCRCVSREWEVTTRCARSTCFHPSAKLWFTLDPLITWAHIKVDTRVTYVYTVSCTIFSRLLKVVNCRLSEKMCVSLNLLKVNANFSATSWPPTRAVTWLAAASNKWNAQIEASSCSAASAGARLSHAAEHIQTGREVFFSLTFLFNFFFPSLLEKVTLLSYFILRNN